MAAMHAVEHLGCENALILRKLQELCRAQVHYLSIFNDSVYDVFELMRRYQDRQEELQRIAASAQRFAGTFLCPRAHALYWAEVLWQYNKLFGAGTMHDFIEQEVWPALQAGGVYPAPGEPPHFSTVKEPPSTNDPRSAAHANP